MTAQNTIRHQEFDEQVRMWVFEEDVEPGVSLSRTINERRENVKYLPGVDLGHNVLAVPSLLDAVEGATLLVFVTPHQFVKGIVDTIKPALHPAARAISLVKGMEVKDARIQRVSDVIKTNLGVDCSVLMGANIASDIALERFSEATIGYEAGQEDTAALWKRLFHTSYFHINTVPDVAGCEMCGTLKNIVALGAGFVDALDFGTNTKSAVMRIGLLEMRLLSRKLFPMVQESTFFESAGVADLITTCFGGRNRKCAEAFARSVMAGKPETWEQVESRLLGGQKLQGVLTSYEVQEVIREKGLQASCPLFMTIHRICTGAIPPDAIVRYAEHP
jgi:glycerol-3-phosphate dehydrogenase (NAD+)